MIAGLRHPRNGTIYFWCLAAVFLSSSSLAAVRWASDYHLFVLGALSFAAACLGRQARRSRWPHWVRLHITGTGSTCVFPVDRVLLGQRQEPAALKDLPSVAYWLLPAAVGIPLIVRALLWHPLLRPAGLR